MFLKDDGYLAFKDQTLITVMNNTTFGYICQYF